MSISSWIRSTCSKAFHAIFRYKWIAFGACVAIVVVVALVSCQGLVNANGSDNQITISDSLNVRR